jgi:hypothetical protein
MAEYTGSLDSKSIKEMMLDQVGDAIGGDGSLSVISGGSVDERHSIITHVLEEAEGMGCLVAVCDCTRTGSKAEPLSTAMSALSSSIGEFRGSSTPTMVENVSEPERSYREEMAGLGQLRAVTNKNAVVVVVEELGLASLATVSMFCFLARNVGGMNALIIATHRSLDDDRLLLEKLGGVRHDVQVNHIHLQAGAEDHNYKGNVLDQHDAVVHMVEPMTRGVSGESPLISQIVGHISSSRCALASGDTRGSISEAQTALERSMSIDHHGLVLDSCTAVGVSMTQAGREKEALEAFDRAIGLAMVVGEPRSQFIARILRSELLLFSVGEPDSASVEAASAGEFSRQALDETHWIEPMALLAIIEARNGRRERAEKLFCEASSMLEKHTIDSLFLERMLLALAAAILLESRYDLKGMNARYGEAEVLAYGTDRPGYWGAIVSLQHGRSLLMLKRPREAKEQLDQAAQRFQRLGNNLQSARASRASEESEAGPMLD